MSAPMMVQTISSSSFHLCQNIITKQFPNVILTHLLQTQICKCSRQARTLFTLNNVQNATVDNAKKIGTIMIPLMNNSSISKLTIKTNIFLNYSGTYCFCNSSKNRNIHTSHNRLNSVEHKCWKCGKVSLVEKGVFFCECGIIQKPTEDLNLFAVLDIEESFQIDTEKLTRKYKLLQGKLHPDRFTLKSELEKSYSVDQSALANMAYFTLMKPLSRALYMLELAGYPMEETSSHDDPDFLMTIMEINETLADANDVETVQEIEKDNSEHLNRCISCLTEYFKAQEYEKARDVVKAMKYYSNIDDKVKLFYRDRM